MTVMRSSWKVFVGIILLAVQEYGRSGCAATRLLNVRNNDRVQPRTLLFPETAPTRVQFIGGIGIPVEDLNFESVTSGYVLKAEYFLPIRATEFHQKLKPQSIHRRRRRNSDTDETDFLAEELLPVGDRETNVTAQGRNIYNQTSYVAADRWGNQEQRAGFYRWILYKAVEMALNNSKLNGHVCLQRCICEHAATPFDHESGLLAEILHIILTPSTSNDYLLKPINKDYLEAEVLGYSGTDCSSAFKECRKSPLDLISTVFDTTDYSD